MTTRGVRRAAAWFVAALLLCSCSDGRFRPDVAADAREDETGTGDLPGDRSDGLEPGDIEVTIVSPVASQRGPVILDYSVSGTGGVKWDIEASWKWNGGTEYLPCTSLVGYGDPPESQVGDGAHRFVWDSMHDYPYWIGPIHVRIRIIDIQVYGNGSGQALTADFGLMNAEDMPRQVLLTHYINQGTAVRPLVWTHGQGLAAAGAPVEVAPSPSRAEFAPNGRTAVVIEEGNETLRFFRYDLEALALVDTISYPVSGLYPVDMVFSGDGTALYLLHSSPDTDGGLYRYDLDPATGTPETSGAPEQIFSQYVPGSIALLPEGRGFAILGADPGGDMDGVLLVTTDLDGQVRDELVLGSEGSTMRSVAASPDGDWLLVTWFNLLGDGDRAALVAADQEGALTWVDEVALEDPEEVAFTADSHMALVAEAYPNRVTGLEIQEGGLVKHGSAALGLPIRMAHPRWGPDRDVFLVTSVALSGESGIGIARVSDAGDAVLSDTYVLGGGIEMIPGDAAIQP